MSLRRTVLFVGIAPDEVARLAGVAAERLVGSRRVDWTATGAEAIARLGHESPAVCVVAHPLGAGAFLGAWRAAEARIPVIVLCLEEPGAALTQLREQGAADVLRPEELRGLGLLRSIRWVLQRSRSRARLRAIRQTLRDPVTGLIGRGAFLRLLVDVLAAPSGDARTAPASLEARWTLLRVDLDRFRRVNESLGHEAADELLREVARRLVAIAGEESRVARFGDDEFALLAPLGAKFGEPSQLAAAVEQAVRTPISIAGREIFSTASIGIASAPADGSQADELLRAADLALREARRRGTGRWAVFAAPMHARAMRRLQVESHLHRAIERNELVLHYQPVVDIETTRLEGFEALVRWRHPEEGLIAPGEFLPLAEETGLMIPIGRWILAEACRQLRVWQQRFDDRLWVAVNLSGIEMAQTGLVERVHRSYEDAGLTARDLKIEVTESLLQSPLADPGPVLCGLRELGVALFLDDFGTGSSSLASLHDYPIHTLKIDRSFVSRLGDDEKGGSIVRTILQLARSMRLEVIAEGVETAVQSERLRALGCRSAQGYYYSPPLSVDAVEELLARDRSLAA